jgi:hypothetical protein
MISADPHRPATFLALQNERFKFFLDPEELMLIFGISVVSLLESFLVRIIAGVDPDFLDMFRSDHGGVGSKMDVRNQRDSEAAFIQPGLDMRQVGGFIDGRRRYPDYFASRLDQLNHLGYGRFGVHRIGNGHRLYADWIIAAHADIPDHDFAGFTPAIRK